MSYKKWIIVSVFPFCLSAITLTVNVPGDNHVNDLPQGGTFSGTSGDLRGVLNHINLNSGSSYTINFATPVGSTITLNAMLPLLNFPFTTNNALTINGKIDGVGPSITIDGNNAWRGFFIANGTGPAAALTQITIQDMIIQNVTSVGGTGGGGGMGAGAALFVDSAAVTLSNVTINNASVVGGAGGFEATIGNGHGGGGLGIGSTGSSTSGQNSGGGGLGGNGISTHPGAAGGGGGGINCGANYAGLGGDPPLGSSPGNAGGTGGGVSNVAMSSGGTGGTSSAPDNQPGGAGGLSGGGGGSGGGGFAFEGGGGGGGVQGTSGTFNGGMGGYGGGGGAGGLTGAMGGFGGGGGGGGSDFRAGNGGFGGGGGSNLGLNVGGGDGGFGGGGGGPFNFNQGKGGIGGGRGGGNSMMFTGGAGGGAGFGGAIFVRNGSLTINGPFSTSGNSAMGGAAGDAFSFAGWQAGTDFFFLTGVATIIDPNGGSITIPGTIGDDSAVSFVGAPIGVTKGNAAGAAVQIGTNLGGSVTYKGVNTYSGGTTIDSGTLFLFGSGALSPAGNVTVNNNVTTGTFDISQISASGQTIGNLSGVSGTFVKLGSKNLTLGTSSSSTYAGVINDGGAGGGTGGTITKQNSGTLTLSGANLYTGITTLNGGKLQAGANSAFSPNSAITMVDTTTLDLNNFLETIPSLSGAGTITLGSGTLTTGSGGSTSFLGSISGVGGSLVKTGNTTFTITGSTSSYTGGTTVSGGTLQGDTTSIQGNILNNGAVVFDQTASGLGTYSGNMSGSGSVTTQALSGQSILIFSGTNTYSGPTNVNIAIILRAGAMNTFSPNSEMILANSSSVILDLNGFSQTIGSLSGGGSSGGSVVMDGVTLITGSKGSTTYSGSIAGFGGGTNLVKVGTNTTFTLAGTNSYGGPTQVQQGILQAGKVNAFSPSSNIIMSNTAGATLDLNNFSQQILSLSGGGTTGGNVTLGSGTLTTGPTLGNVTYFGSISGTGGLTKVGTGTFMLEGSNTYFGTTTVMDGVLVANNANPNELSPNSAIVMNNLSTAHLFVFNSQTIASLGGGGASGGNVQIGMLNGVLTTGGGGSSTYGGSITGAGNAQLIKVGATTFNLTGSNTIAGTTVNAGTLNLTGTNTFTTTTINGGNLAVNGPLTSTVTVEPSGTLSGNSTITGVVTNNGTISPGNSIDTLTIVGQYIQASGSTYLVEVSPTLSDRIAVIGVPGTATIQSNTTLHISPMPGTYSVSNTYLILSTLNGVTGTFTNVPNDLPTVQFAVLYTPALAPLDVFLEVISIPIATVTCGGNIGKVAQYIDTLSPPMGSDLTNVIHILRSMTDMDALNQALAELQPAPYKNLVLAQEENVFTISRGISDHLNTLLNPYCHKKPDEKADARTNSRTKANTPKKVDRKKQYELWGSVFGDWASLNNRSSSHCKADETLGYGAKGGGALFGADYYFTEHWALGVTSAYSYSYVNVNESRVKGHINSVYGALYGIWQENHLFFDAALIAGYDQFNASRKIQFAAATAGSVHRTAYTTHGGWNVDGHLDGGYIIEPWDVMRICPFVAVDCLFLHENKFHESGADSLDLRVQSSNNLLLRTEGGVYISKCFSVSYGSWTPEVRASAVWEGFNSDAQFYRSNFVGQPGSFVVKNRNPNRVLVSPGAALSGSFYDDQLTMLLDYFGEYGYGYHNQVIKAEFAWAF